MSIKHKLLCLAVAVFLMIAYACKTTTPAATASTETSQDTITDLITKKIIKDRELFAATTEAIALDSAYLAGDVLHVLTQKTNACESKNFKMMWNGMMAKSLPPQTSLKLFLMADATCKEMHYFHLTFDVTPLRFKEDTVRVDTTYNKATIIKLGGLKQALKYNF